MTGIHRPAPALGCSDAALVDFPCTPLVHYTGSSDWRRVQPWIL
jgi:hypothetical protein